MNQTLYKDDNIHIEFNDTEKWLEVDWIGLQTVDTVKQGCLQMLDLLKQYNCTKVLNDNTHVLGSWAEAVEWGAEFWFPAMMNAGLKHFAWIYSPGAFSKMSTDKTIALTDGDIFATFDNKEQAAVWLKNAA